MAQTDIFLKLGNDIKGESIDDVFKDHINVDSFSWGISQQGTFSGAGGHGGTAGRSSVHNLQMTKHICKASPDIMLACATGKAIPEATLFVRKAGDTKPFVYFQLLMKNVLVSTYNTGSGGGQGALISEQFALNFQELEMSYWQQTAQNTQGPKVTKKYDSGTNKGS